MSDASSKAAAPVAPTPPVSEQPDTRPKWGVPSAILLVLVSFVALPIIAQIVITSIPSILSWDAVRTEDWTSRSTVGNFLYVFMVEAMTVGLLAWFARRKRISLAQLVGLRRPKGSDVGYALLGVLAYIMLFIVALSLVSAIVSIDTEKEQAIGFDKGIEGFDLMLAFVSLAVLPPIVEEMVFRGFFFGTLRSRKVRFALATLVTSLVFGALHLFGAGDGSLLWIAFFDTFILSLILCYMREKTGSIWATVIIHALKNTFVFVNLFIIGGR